MRTHLVVLVAALALVSIAPASRACSVCFGWVVPSGGEVPANLPGIAFAYRGPPLPSPLVTVTELDPDGAERPLELTIEDGLARFSRPLVAGKDYRVTHPGCGQAETFTLHAGASAPLPATLGTLRVGEVVDGARAVPTSRGTCTTEAQVRGRELTLVLSDAAKPWAAALSITWSADNGGVLGPEAALQKSDWAERLIYQACAIAEPEGVDAALMTSPHVVTVSAHIPGVDADLVAEPGVTPATAIAPATTAVEIDCEDDSWVNGSEGCAGGPPVGVLGAALGLVVYRRRRTMRRPSSTKPATAASATINSVV